MMRAQTVHTIPANGAVRPMGEEARAALCPAASYGYVRVSSRERDEEEQLSALYAAGVPEESIFMDIYPLQNPAESEFAQLVGALREGDCLYIKGLDNFGNCYEDVITQWHFLCKIKKVSVIVLDIPLLDTRTQLASANEGFLCDLVMQFLSYVSKRERESIRQRQHEGILAAQQRGVRFGRPPKPIPPQFEALLQQWKNREISSRKAAQQLGVAQETFLRWSRKREQNLI